VPVEAAQRSPIEPETIALDLYLIGVAVLLLRAGVGWVVTRRLEQTTHLVTDADLLARLDRHATAAGLRRSPRLLTSPRLLVPMTTSVLRPAIVLPAQPHDWSPAKLDAVLVHELAHVARRDTLTQRLSLIYRAVFWPNPLSWWLHHRLAVLAEQVSDEAALDAGVDRATYAETLVGFFADQARGAGRRAVWHVAMARGANAEKRVEHVLSWQRGRSTSLTKSMTMGLVVAAAPVLVLAASVRPEPTATPKTEQHALSLSLPPQPGATGLTQPESVRIEPGPRNQIVDASNTSTNTPDAPPLAMAPSNLSADRWWVLLFDGTGTAPADFRNYVDMADKWLDKVMSEHDAVALTTIGSARMDFTHFKAALRNALARLQNQESSSGDAAVSARLGAVKTLCKSLAAIDQRKAILYVGPGIRGATPSASESVEGVLNACDRANVSLYTLDSRGELQAALQTGFGAGAYLPGGGIKNPAPIHAVDPKYTDEARLAGIQGNVDLDIVVLANGTVGDVRVTKSLEPGLDAQAILSAKQWLFKPAMKDGAPVNMIVGLAIEFRLRGVPPANPAAVPNAAAPNTQGIVPPKPIKSVSPRYTSEAMRAKIEGDVDVEAVVLTDGSVGDVRVTKSLDPGLDEAAVAAAQQWRFQPATKDGQPVEYTVTLSLEFRMYKGTPAPAKIEAYPPDTPGLVAPTITKRVDPKYTSDAMRAKIQGDVDVEVVVQADGTIGEIRVTKSLDTQFGLDQEAITAVKQFTFTPATLYGLLVPAIVKVNMEFRIH
jgi:TonB family protein